LAVAPASGLIDSAAVEAAIIAGRQLIQFLGLGIEFRGNERPSLKSKTCYERYKKGDDYYTAEVKVVNVGGGFTEMADSTEKEKRTLAEFLHGASKATAHLTEGSGHTLNENDGRFFTESQLNPNDS
jgi:hypothetical protein